MGRFTLIGAGAMMVVVGALHLFAPRMMMEAPGIALTSAAHLHVIRAAYGGAYLGIGALFLLGLASPAQRAGSLRAVALIFSGFALGRLTSLAVDGVPTPLYLGVLVFEIVFAALAILSLRRG